MGNKGDITLKAKFKCICLTSFFFPYLRQQNFFPIRKIMCIIRMAAIVIYLNNNTKLFGKNENVSILDQAVGAETTMF